MPRDPDFITQTRNHLALDQSQTAALCVGGANTYSRHKNSKNKPPLALVKLFKRTDRHPDLRNKVGTPDPF